MSKSEKKELSNSLKELVASNTSLNYEQKSNKGFIKFASQVSKLEIEILLCELWNGKYEISFLDIVYPIYTDPGAYITYSTEKKIDENHWSMTLGNHGWSGGVYHIRKETVSQQIYNLVNKQLIDELEIIGAVFSSHYDTKSPEESAEMDQELFFLHSEHKAE